MCENRSKLEKIAELFVFGGGKTANQGKKSSEEKKKNKNIKEAATNIAPGREEQSESCAAEVCANQNKAHTSSTTCDTNSSCAPPKTFHAFGNAPIEVLFVDEYLEKRCGGGFYHHLAAPTARPGRKSIELWQRLQKVTWDRYEKKTPGRNVFFSSSSGHVLEMKTPPSPPQEHHDYSVEKVNDSLTRGGEMKIHEEIVGPRTSAADAEVVLGGAGGPTSTTTTTVRASKIKVRKLDKNDGHAAGGTGTNTRDDLLAGAPPVVDVDDKKNTAGTLMFSVPPPSTTSSSGFSTTKTTLFNIKKQKFWKNNCTNMKIPTVLWQPNPVLPEYWKLMLEYRKKKVLQLHIVLQDRQHRQPLSCRKCLGASFPSCFPL